MNKNLILILLSKASSLPNMKIGAKKQMTLESRYHDLSNNTSFEPNGGQKGQKAKSQNGMNHAKVLNQ